MSESLYSEHGLIAGGTHDGTSLIDNTRLTVIMMLTVDVLLFGGLIGGFFMLRSDAGPLPYLAHDLVLLATVSLAISSGCSCLAIQAQHHNELGRMRVALGATSLFLVAFLALNLLEWYTVFADGSLIRSVFAGMYVLLTGTFHFHVAGALLVSSMKFRQTLRWRHYTRSTNSTVHLALFLLTMLAVWVTIYMVVYT